MSCVSFASSCEERSENRIEKKKTKICKSWMHEIKIALIFLYYMYMHSKVWFEPADNDRIDWPICASFHFSKFNRTGQADERTERLSARLIYGLFLLLSFHDSTCLRARRSDFWFHNSTIFIAIFTLLSNLHTYLLIFSIKKAINLQYSTRGALHFSIETKTKIKIINLVQFFYRSIIFRRLHTCEPDN